MIHQPSPQAPVLVLGASGYIGGRLLPRLLDSGYSVRAAVRSPEKLQCRPYASHPRLEIASADLLEPDTLPAAMHSCRTAFYLVQSMRRHGALDRLAARNTREAASEAGLERIIYLGCLMGEGRDVRGDHLRSRQEVGQILCQGRVPVTWLRTAIILGAGSAPFEMFRHLAERLPVMLTPRWFRTISQPIAVSNVLDFLQGCLETGETSGRILDVCGPESHSYRELLAIYAEAAGLPRRLILPLPTLSPRLSAFWINLVTPVPASLARPLIEDLRDGSVCKENTIQDLIPQHLLSCREAIVRALEGIGLQQVETCWSDAGSLRTPEWIACGDAAYSGGSILQSRYKIVMQGSPELLWPIVAGLGGNKGWLFANRLWKIRGLADRLLGGPGLRRGRRDHHSLRVGDALDFWRVLQVEENRKLSLLAEMKLPGQATLELELRRLGPERTELRLTAGFLPRGLTGLLYWWLFYPFHAIIFPGMLRGLAQAANAVRLSGPEPFDPKDESCRIPRNH